MLSEWKNLERDSGVRAGYVTVNIIRKRLPETKTGRKREPMKE